MNIQAGVINVVVFRLVQYKELLCFKRNGLRLIHKIPHMHAGMHRYGIMRQFLFIPLCLRRIIHIQQMTGNEFAQVDIGIFKLFAMVEHVAQLGQHREIALWQEDIAQEKINRTQYKYASFEHAAAIKIKRFMLGTG